MSVPVYGSPLYFSPIDVDERIGRALVRMIFLKYGALDAGTYADADALRAAVSRTLSDVETIGTSLAHATALGRTYAWSVTSTLADDGLSVIQPNDRPTGAGRWLSAPFRDFRGPYQWHGLECVGLVDRAVPVEGKPNQQTMNTFFPLLAEVVLQERQPRRATRCLAHLRQWWVLARKLLTC